MKKTLLGLFVLSASSLFSATRRSIWCDATIRPEGIRTVKLGKQDTLRIIIPESRKELLDSTTVWVGTPRDATKWVTFKPRLKGVDERVFEPTSSPIPALPLIPTKLYHIHSWLGHQNFIEFTPQEAGNTTVCITFGIVKKDVPKGCIARAHVYILPEPEASSEDFPCGCDIISPRDELTIKHCDPLKSEGAMLPRPASEPAMVAAAAPAGRERAREI